MKLQLLYRVKRKIERTLDKRRLRRILIDIFLFVHFTPKLKGGNGCAQNVIVSLTSYGKRVNCSVHYTLFSIISQSIQPSRIILWLDNVNWSPTNLPMNLYRLKKLGIEIKFCEDIKSYKKIIPTLELTPDSIIVTADDDIFYPKQWLGSLLSAHSKSPKSILCHRAHEIRLSPVGDPLPYMQWNFCVRECPQRYIFPTFGAGALFPPHSLHQIATDKHLFLSLCPSADDIWIWAMAKLQNTQFEIIKNCISDLDYINLENQSTSLFTVNGIGGENDIQFKKVIHAFSINI
jgi:hypothetical protein